MEWSTSRQAVPSFWIRTNSQVIASTFGGLIRLFQKQRNFFDFPDTSAATIREYLGEGARDPNLDTENGSAHGPFFKDREPAPILKSL